MFFHSANIRKVSKCHYHRTITFMGSEKETVKLYFFHKTITNLQYHWEGGSWPYQDPNLDCDIQKAIQIKQAKVHNNTYTYTLLDKITIL